MPPSRKLSHHGHTDTLKNLIVTFDALFALTRTAQDRWTSLATPRTSEKRVFGGVLIGQAIVAASVQTRRCHALHAFFIGVGEPEKAFDTTVERIRDGGSFATRRFDIRQGERHLLTGHSSHHDGDYGPDGQVAMPDVPPPEKLEDQRVTRANHASSTGQPTRRYLSAEMLDARPMLPSTPAKERAVWFRPRSPITGGRDIHQAVVGFASDAGLIHTGLHTHARGIDLQSASLDHSIWFHRDASVNEWMLHVQSGPTMAHGRGFSRATIFTRQGVLVASVAQEYLARRKRPTVYEGHGIAN